MSDKLHKVACFSQTGSTRKVADTIHEAFAGAGWDSRVLEVPFDDPGAMSEANMLGIGSPVFYWATPTPVAEWIGRLPDGGGRPAYVFTTYGHVYPSNALHEMASLVAGRGYTLVGGVVTPARHNLAALSGEHPEFGADKPDGPMLAELTEFANRLIERIGGESGASVALEDFIAGRQPQNFIRGLLPLRMLIDGMPRIFYDRDACGGCGVCSDNCPQGVIRMEGGKAVRESAGCLRCAQCLRNCPNEALTADAHKALKLLRMAKKMAMTPEHKVLAVE